MSSGRSFSFKFDESIWIELVGTCFFSLKLSSNGLFSAGMSDCFSVLLMSLCNKIICFDYYISKFFIMSTPLGGGHIIFAFSAVRRHTWFPDILGNSSYPIFTKFGMQVYWVNSLYGIAFGDDSSIAN